MSNNHTSHLFIGGPCDGETLAVNTLVPFGKVAIHPKTNPTYGVTPSDASQLSFQTATYERTSLNGYIVYIHESITLQDAIGFLIGNYKY